MGFLQDFADDPEGFQMALAARRHPALRKASADDIALIVASLRSSDDAAPPKEPKKPLQEKKKMKKTASKKTAAKKSKAPFKAKKAKTKTSAKVIPITRAKLEQHRQMDAVAKTCLGDAGVADVLDLQDARARIEDDADAVISGDANAILAAVGYGGCDLYDLKLITKGCKAKAREKAPAPAVDLSTLSPMQREALRNAGRL